MPVTFFNLILASVARIITERKKINPNSTDLS